MSEKIIKLWEVLAQEADLCRDDPMPEVVIRDFHAPSGYRAQLVVKRMPIYHRAFEIKARGWIQNMTTKEVQYESGEWLLEKSANRRLQEALQALEQLSLYRKAMATKNAPVADSSAII